MTAAIVIDNWKLKIFKKSLKEKGYQYAIHPGVTPGTRTLKVRYDDVVKLTKFIKETDQKAVNSKLN